MAWKVEICTSSDPWVGNALRFATKDEAENYGADLWSRWTAITSFRTIECSDKVNCRWDEKLGDGRGRAIEVSK